MAYFEEMDVDPYDEDEFFINLGLYPGGIFNETPGTRALQSLPSILGQIAGRASEMGRDYGDEDYIYRPIYETPEGTIEMQGPMHTIPVSLDQEVGGGGAPRMPTTTTTATTDSAASSGDYGPFPQDTGTGVRPITLPTGQVINVPENLNPFQLLTQGYISREVYERLAGDRAIPDSRINQEVSSPEITEVSDLSGEGLRRNTTEDPTIETPVTDIMQTTVGTDTSQVSDLSGGGLRRTMNEEEEDFEGDDGVGDFIGQGGAGGQGGQGGTGGTGYGGTGQGGAGGAGGTGTGGTASVVFNPYQPTLSPFELGEYGRLIPSTQSGVLPELADFMNYYGASVPGMTQQMADVTGAGQTAYAQQVLGMEGDAISAFDIAQEASRQQRGALGDVFGLGPDATYADITAAGTAPMEALSQVRGTVLPGLESAFQTAQERLEKGLTGRERQQVEQATRARFGALGRGADTAALATEIGDIMQEERGLYSRNLQDLLGIGQTTGALIGQEAYAMSPFTQAAIGSADLGPGLALAGDIGRQAAAATPSPTDLFGLEAGERQFGLDLEALEAAASAGDLNVVSSLLGTIGSAFRGGPYAGLQQQNLGTPPYFPQQSQENNPYNYF